MSWQKKLPNLQKLNKLKQMSKEQVLEPLIIEMPATSTHHKFFVIVEFRTDVIVEMFKNEDDARQFATAIFETLEVI